MSAHSKIYYFTCLALAALTLVILAACGDNTATVAPLAAATTGVTPTLAAATNTTAPTATVAVKATATTVAATTPANPDTTVVASNSSSDTLDPAKVESGRKVFVTQCQVCHLNGGKSSGGVGPNLAFSRKATDPVKVRTNIRNGVDAMPAFDTTKISDTELENIVLYLKSIHQN